jgi:hypothetical protein
MKKILKILPFTESTPEANRQYINACSVFTAWEESVNKAESYRGGMFWKQQGGRTYLIQASPANAQKSLGPRTDETIAIFDKFTETKEWIESRLKDLKKELILYQKLNRIYNVGHAQKILIDVLNTIYLEGLSSSFAVVGSCSLYAYETAAGVRLTNPEVYSTNNASFAVDKKVSNTLIHKILKKADKTFTLLQSQPFVFKNDKGFTLRLIPNESTTPDTIKPFSTMVVSKSGHMARMNTTTPGDFVRIKSELAAQMGRDPSKRKRDEIQAEIVKMLIKEFLPMYA